MANLPETPDYDAGVYQLETTDPVQGGASGVSNAPLKNLANRTTWLKQAIDSILASLGGTAPLNSPTFTGDPKGPTPALGDNDTSFATTAFVQKTVGGFLSKSVAGGANVTLTAVEAGNAILQFTGALTENIAVIVPTVPTRGWVIKNATSGSFTLTVKTAAGTGVVCTQGKNAVVWTDGTNVYDVLTDFDNVAMTGTPTAPSPATGDDSTKVATTEFVFDAADGMATVGVGGAGDVTLTAGQYGMAIINLTGTPSGPKNIIFPAQTGVWVVDNNQGGLNNITAITAAVGSTGKVMPQGSAVVIYSDGTNIEFASSSAQVSFTPVQITGVTGTTLTVPGGYTPGNIFIEKNGGVLQPADFTATDGTTIALTTAAVSTDKFTVYVFTSFTVADAVKKSGDTMSGPLTLAGDPVNTLEAATKQYVDNNAGGGTIGSFSKLLASATGASATVSVTADAAVVENASNQQKIIRNLALSGTLTASGANGLDDTTPQAVTISIASPGVVSQNNHGYPANAAVVLATTGALPTGLTAGTTYYVVNPTTNTYQLSATKGGSAINTTGSQSGTHTVKSVLAASSWYSRWIIWNGSTSALLWSSSLNPVLPAGYTHKTRCGWDITDSSVNKYPLSFSQVDREVAYKTAAGTNTSKLPTMVSGTQGSTPSTFASVAVGNFIPPTAAIIKFLSADTGSGSFVIVAPNNSYSYQVGATISGNPAPYQYNGSGTSANATSTGELMLESRNLYVILGASTAVVNCIGWKDSF